MLLLLCLFSLQDTVCGFTTEYLDLIDYNLYTVRCCTTYEYVFVYTCLLLWSVLLYCCCYSCCCLLLLFVIVCRTAKLLLWFSASDSSVFFLFIQTRFFFNAPLGSTYCRIFSVNFFTYNTHHTYILGITGMRGAKAGVSPPRWSPLAYIKLCTDRVCMKPRGWFVFISGY